MTATRQNDRIRESWQPRRLHGAPAKLWLIVRRTAASLIALGLVTYCGYLLISLLSYPQTYCVYLTAKSYAPLVGQPVRFAHRDARAFETLKPAFASLDLDEAVEFPLTRRVLEKKLEGLRNLELRKKDVLIVYLVAHGIVQNGKAYLLCEGQGATANQERFPIADLLEALKGASAGTKLLILDAGRDTDRANRPFAFNNFPRVLEKAVEAAQDPSLWVLSANASLEQSHDSPALHHSVLAYWLANGLKGLADENQDSTIDLDELYNYVRVSVSAWVAQATSNNESQTPQLLNCEQDQLAARPPFLMYTTRLPKASVPDVRHDAESASADVALPSIGESVQASLSAPTQDIAVIQQDGGSPPNPDNDETSSGSNADDLPALGEPGEANSSPGPGGSEPVESGANNAGLARQQLSKAWALTEKMASSDESQTPWVLAPAEWRELFNRLLWYEQLCTADVPPKDAKWGVVVADLERLNRSMEAFSSDDATGTADNVVERIKAQVPQSPFGNEPIPNGSLAMFELVASHDRERPLPKDLKSFRDNYDALLAREDATRTELKTLIDATDNKLGLNRFYEFQLLDLCSDRDVPWKLIRSALQTRRIGEQAAANLYSGDGWSQDTIDAADRLRWEGEGLIRDRTDSAWVDKSESKLSDARKKYDLAITEVARVQALFQERDQTLAQLPEFVRWQRFGVSEPDSSQIAELNRLFAVLEPVDAALSTPGRDSLDRVEDLHSDLQGARSAFEHRLEILNNPWRIANLLATSLPPAGSRDQLRAELAESESSEMRSFLVPESDAAAATSPALTEQRWNKSVEQLKLEAELARLAGHDKEGLQKLDQILESSEEDHWIQLDEAAQLFQGPLAASPELSELIADASDMSDGKTRSTKLTRLRSMFSQWLLLGPQAPDQVERPKYSLVSQLNQASWYDLLLWQRRRFDSEALDVPLSDAEFLRSTSATYGNIAKKIPKQPEIDKEQDPLFTLEELSDVALVTEDESLLSVTVKSNANSDMPIWLVAQYDPGLLDVEGVGVISQTELQVKATQATGFENATAMEYPLRPDRLEFAATEQMPARGTRIFPLRIRRLNNARGTTKLILRAFGQGSFVRRELNVELPGRELLEVLVDDRPEFQSKIGDRITLHPLPNHVRSIKFDIANRAKVEKKLEVSLWIPSRVPESDDAAIIPVGAIREKAKDDLWTLLGPTQIGPTMPIQLPDSDAPVRLRFTPTDPMQTVDPKANLLATGPVTADKFPGIPMRHGLLVVMKDQENGEFTIRRIEIAPQRPHRYLQATARFDDGSKRLEIKVTPIDKSAIPPNGIKVGWTVVGGISGQSPSRPTADLKAPDYSAVLYGHLPPNAPEEITAYVHVDNYPRAFIFRVDPSASSTDIEPVVDEMEVRIISPDSTDIPDQTPAYKAPLDTIPAIVEIDAPQDAFSYEDSKSYVEVGIDEDSDRELQGEPTLRRRSDRQIDVVATSLTADGTLTLDTRVGDYRLNVPTNGLKNLEPNLLARLVVPNSQLEAFSDPLEICLDGDGPRIGHSFRPGKEIPVGSELEVQVFLEVDDLSGVQKVEATFDTIATAENQQAPWEQAQPDGNAGWIVKLKTDKLAVGAQTVLIRAADKVGNPSDVVRDVVQIVDVQARKTPAAAATPKNDQPNSIAGRVLYGAQPVPAASVALESLAGPAIAPVTSGADGRFEIAKVPPGNYTLKARSLVRNGYRRAEMSITVPALPKKLPDVAVKLE